MATKKKPAPPRSSPAASPTSKAAALQAVIAKLQHDLDDVLRAAKEAHTAATHEEAKPENDKDTRGLVESYLAAGQAARAGELQRDLQALKTMALAVPDAASIVAPGAVVTLRDDDTDAVTRYFLLPAGAGAQVDVDGERTLVVTPQAPLARAVMGRRVGDVVDVVIAGKARSFAIDHVA